MNLSNFNPYPSIYLDEEMPTNTCSDGYKVCLSAFCKKKLPSDEKCLSFYENLKKYPANQWLECPFGFSSFKFKLGDKSYAITGIIPFPRTESTNEKTRSKFVSDRADKKDVESFVTALSNLQNEVIDKITRDTSRNLAALHEIRKYNRNIKQSLERWCRSQSSYDPDLAAPEVVKSWKLSELMSYQFEILGLIADEGLTHIIPKTRSEIYKIFDKCQRIYKSLALDKNISLWIEGDSPISLVSDKTFPIIATVLIENGIKYAPKDSKIVIEVKNLNKDIFRVMIRNELLKDTIIPEEIFERGCRGNQDTEGSGIGLYLAQMVAKQHNTEIKYKIHSAASLRTIEFYFEMKRTFD